MEEGKLQKALADGAEIVAASVPWVASLGVALGKARTERALGALNARVDALAEQVQAYADQDRLDELAEDPAFFAAFEKTAAAVRLSESEERLEWLRNGFVNGYVLDQAVEDREVFMDLARRYTPRHIQVLAQHTDYRSPLGRRLRKYGGERLEPGWRNSGRTTANLQTLAADGLLEQIVEVDAGTTFAERNEDPEAQLTYQITSIGTAFLEFISEPDESAGQQG
ncbi:hypothetical protein [Demequina zhanjiangensis]|uniref:Uncharacterized protein n=1 Tax=Demequina zhanjiangensis TaxID=3051659 RepID=A0ABT8G357_9MICO|nr:hypothetical protein [Demequina sp. SYSU T00b26]MDN4473578.1 hypothetical protein [Demequina sp. SYSU T00b26]